ncbi:MAG: hypothetical protein NO515_08175, partial [Candidatus Methanomethylicia archaeon]|nr:hypothetical protein [Candidatus Methanomethylicia archaeon]
VGPFAVRCENPPLRAWFTPCIAKFFRFYLVYMGLKYIFATEQSKYDNQTLDEYIRWSGGQ